jgi:hypothetical protein
MCSNTVWGCAWCVLAHAAQSTPVRLPTIVRNAQNRWRIVLYAPGELGRVQPVSYAWGIDDFDRSAGSVVSEEINRLTADSTLIISSLDGSLCVTHTTC